MSIGNKNWISPLAAICLLLMSSTANATTYDFPEVLVMFLWFAMVNILPISALVAIVIIIVVVISAKTKNKISENKQKGSSRKGYYVLVNNHYSWQSGEHLEQGVFDNLASRHEVTDYIVLYDYERINLTDNPPAVHGGTYEIIPPPMDKNM